MIIVTGSTGFLGSLLIPKIVKKNKVLCLIPDSGAIRMAGKGIPEEKLIENYEGLGVKTMNYPAHGNVNDYRKALTDIHSPLAVVYMAANNNQGATYEVLHKDNVEVLSSFMEALGNKLKGVNFIFTSSVMAKACSTMLDSGFSFNTLKKIAPYGLSKLMAEKKISEYSKKYGFKPVILRLGSLYGKTSSMGLMISVKGMANLAKKIPIPSTPGKLGIIEASDVASVIADIVDKDLDDTIYYVDDKHPLSMGELVHNYGKNNGFKTKQFEVPKFLINIGSKLEVIGAKAGIAPALKILALLDDVYVDYDTRIWNITNINPERFEKGKTSIPKEQHHKNNIKVAITGATGMIGSRLVKRLWEKGFTVRCGIHDSRNISKIPEGIEYMRCDLADPASFVKGQDIVIHAAALTASRKYKKSEYQKININGTANLAKACEGVKRFVFFGSEAAHASAKGIYGRSKYLAEQQVKKQKINWTILKPGQVISREAFISKLATKIKKGAFVVPIPANTPKNLELIDIDSLVEHITDIIVDKRFEHKVVYLGSKKRVNIEEVIDKICKMTKKTPLKIKLPELLLKMLSHVPLSPVTTNMVDSLYTPLPAKEENDSVHVADESWEKILNKYS